MVQTTLRIPEELYEYLKAEAKIRGMTFNGYVLSRLWEKEAMKGEKVRS